MSETLRKAVHYESGTILRFMITALIALSSIESFQVIAGEAHLPTTTSAALPPWSMNLATLRSTTMMRSNLLGIVRFTPGMSGIGIYTLLPGKGAIGNQVKIQGYGFSTTPANNTVTFNGTAR